MKPTFIDVTMIFAARCIRIGMLHFHRGAWNADAVYRWEFSLSVRPSVCPSVCLSHAWIV